MNMLRQLKHLGENNLALKLFALALAILLYFAVRPIGHELTTSSDKVLTKQYKVQDN